jgi:hypothetical protein
MRAEERKRMMHVSLKKSIREPRTGGNSGMKSIRMDLTSVAEKMV